VESSCLEVRKFSTFIDKTNFFILW